MSSALALSRISLLSTIVVALAGCPSLKQAEAQKPDGIVCESILFGGEDGESLKKAIASAAPGACVIIGTHTYKGSFDVPKGVTIASGQGQRAIVEGDLAEKAAIAIAGGAGSGLCGLAIRDSVGVGISVQGGPVVIKDVTIEKVLGAGIVTQCDDCDDSQALDMRDVRVRQTKLGAWFRGGKVTWQGGLSSDNKSTSLSGGAGIIAQSGTHLSLTNVVVDNNENVGILIDGDGGSTANLDGVRISTNGERGLWAQKVRPVPGQLGLRVARSTFEGNSQVGLGVFESTGVVLEATTVRDTRLKPVAVGLATKDVGDGLLFESSTGEVRDVTLEANQRTAALLAKPETLVTFENLRVSGFATGLKVVKQQDPKVSGVEDKDVDRPTESLALPGALVPTKYTN